MNKLIFVDTSAWIMLINKDEAYHQAAVETYNEMSKATFVVSNLVVGETYTWLRKKVGYKKASTFLKVIEDKNDLNQLKTVYSEPVLEKQAAQLLEKYSEHEFSYADAVSFSIMQNLRVKQAFTYDRHFVIAGFNVINDLPGK